MTKWIGQTRNEVLGVLKGRDPPSKETWWWNDEVQTIIKAKKESFKQWQRDRNEDNIRKYKQACKESKNVVGEAKWKAYEDFYIRLDNRYVVKNIFKIAKRRERKIRDFTQIKCIKSEDSRILVKYYEIKER